jgi:cytochrome c2
MPCPNCNEQNTEHFTYKLQDGTKVPFKKCKKCHNLGNKKPKQTGFGKLEATVQERIKNDILGNRSIVSIAMDENISPETLRRWIHKGI